MKESQLPATLAALRGNDAGGELALATLDAVGVAAYAVSGRGQLLLANRSAERQLAGGQPFVLRAGRLTSRDATGARRLLDAIVSRSEPVVFPLEVAGTRWLASCAPLPVQGATLVVASAARPYPVADRGLRQLLSLSEAEAAVAVLFAGGLSVKQIAYERGVSVYTVRTQVREIFHKAGVRRQQELTQLLAAVPRIDRPGG